jgi:hypothetical protein
MLVRVPHGGMIFEPLRAHFSFKYKKMLVRVPHAGYGIRTHFAARLRCLRSLFV